MFYDVVNRPESEEYRGYLVINFSGILASPFVLYIWVFRSTSVEQNKKLD